MKPLGTHNYFVYILTNKIKTVLYTGATNNLKVRLWEHNEKIYKNSFTSKYNCFYLIYWERFQYVQDALDREKEIKGWTRKKKINLITKFNPDWNFLNDEFDNDL